VWKYRYPNGKRYKFHYMDMQDDGLPMEITGQGVDLEHAFNTAWDPITARNERILRIVSIVRGMDMEPWI